MSAESSRILVVDDHPTNRLKLSMAVRKLGHAAEVAEDVHWYKPWDKVLDASEGPLAARAQYRIGSSLLSEGRADDAVDADVANHPPQRRGADDKGGQVYAPKQAARVGAGV